MSRAEQRRRARSNGKHRASGKKGRRPTHRERRSNEQNLYDALDAAGFVVAESKLPEEFRG